MNQTPPDGPREVDLHTGLSGRADADCGHGERAGGLVPVGDDRILVGDVRAMLSTLPAESVHCVVTSPPYWSLRSYSTTPQLWGGDPDCTHEWSAEPTAEGYTGKRWWQNGTNAGGIEAIKRKDAPDNWSQVTRGDTCRHCGAWRGELGGEPTPELFVSHLVAVFREVKRVLRRDGTCWVNLGDSMSVGTSLLQELQRLVKGSPILCGDGATIRVARKGVKVSLKNNRAPDDVFIPLLGIERITIKQRDNDFGQVLHLLNGPTHAGIAIARSLVGAVIRNASDLQIVLDSVDDISVVISELDTDEHPVFGIAGIGGGASEQPDAALSVEQAGEPISECIADIKPVGDAVALNPPFECIPDVYLVYKAIPLGDAFDAAARRSGNLRVAVASDKHVTFQVGNSGWDLTFEGVRHLYLPDGYGGVTPYSRVYHEAIANANEKAQKQEAGIPFLVRRALMRDGWICRSTIIWSKPNSMPESVTDRPTKSHEYLFLLAKSSRYYYDADAVREALKEGADHDRLVSGDSGPNSSKAVKYGLGDVHMMRNNPAGRNRRSVWEIPTQPTPEAHFATYPEKLVEPCILAGTSEHGVCRECGAPWRRVVERVRGDTEAHVRPKQTRGMHSSASTLSLSGNGSKEWAERGSKSVTTGWQTSCKHDAPAVPATCLDPFLGSGTTGRVAERLGRKWVGIELNENYAEIARRRTAQRGLFQFAAGGAS